MQHMKSNADLQSGGAHADDNLAGLADYRMQELLLHEVLPRLGPAALAHLRATCRSLQSLLDSELCSESWSKAAQRILPGWLHGLPWAPAAASADLLNRSVAPSQSLQHKQTHLSGPSTVAKDAQQTRSGTTGHACQVPTEHTGDAPWGVDEHATGVQQLLRRKVSLLKRLAQPARISCLKVKPRQDTTKGRELWSPCGTWLAMQQYDEKVVGNDKRTWVTLVTSNHAPLECYLSQACSLVVGDMTTMRAQRVCSIPKGRFLALEWLPGSSWLVWAKSDNLYKSTSRQSIFCLDVATGKRHQRRDKPYRVNWLAHRPCIAATAGLMACAEEHKIQLLKLPSLEPMASFGDSLAKGSFVAAMSFDPSAAYIAVCWGRNTCQHPGFLLPGRPGLPPSFDNFDETLKPGLGCAFRLEVFHVSTMKRQLQLYSASKPCCTWSPVKPLLLIASDCIRILDAVAGTYVSVAVEPSDHSKVADTWSADGSMLALQGRQIGSGDRQDHPWACFFILPNGIIYSMFRWEACDPVVTCIDSDVPPACLVDLLLSCPLYGFYLVKDIRNMLAACTSVPRYRPDCQELYRSHGGHWVVAQPLHRTRCGPTKLLQLDLDHASRSARLHLVPCGAVPQSSRPVWHPLPEADGIYALIGEDHDVWLVDGQHHRLLQHWEGSKLLRSDTSVAAGTHRPDTWQRISWSEDGTKLLLVSSGNVIAIDFDSLLSANLDLPLRPVVRGSDRVRRVWKRLLGDKEFEEEISCLNY